MNKYSRSRKTLAHQMFVLRMICPEFTCNHYQKQQRVVWTGPLQPTPLSEVYQVQIDYKLGSFPKVHVLSPELPAGVPHRYKADGRLCLYYPSFDIWSSEQLIAHTIVPWTAHWLWCYEAWLITKKWHADEYQHRGAKREAG